MEALDFVLTIYGVVVSTLCALTVAICLHKVDKYLFLGLVQVTRGPTLRATLFQLPWQKLN